MTKTAAIQHARNNVATVHRFAGQWCFNRYDIVEGAVWVSIPKDYYTAQMDRSQALIDSAAKALEVPTPQYTGGLWTNYVRAL